MTNVKLKLMFFILSALLTADFVSSRPYEGIKNNTDLIIKFPRNNTDGNFNIPVDSNADTLIVANEDLDSPTSDSDSKIDMEFIVDSEQNRDEALSKKVMKDTVRIKITKGNKDPLNKQLNISSSILDGIIDAETGREETMTDILFRPDSELQDVPHLEFLVAVKPNNTDLLVKVNRSVDMKDLGEVIGEDSDKRRNDSDILKKIDYVELVEVIRQSSDNKSAYNLANITGHEVENDSAPDTSFTDVQTLFLACFGTLLPLLAVLFAMLFVRCVCRRWCRRRRVASSVSESSERKQSLNQLKSSTGEDNGVPVGSTDANSGTANGSIITMTLKNNHLIVETEERNDITKNGRETKMKYSPDNDGIFVVEVQQSAAYRPNNNKSIQSTLPRDPQISTNLAQIHRVPEELENKLDQFANAENFYTDEASEKSEKIDRDKPLTLSNTGLSISDLSMSSIGSHNVSYSYGSQMGYEQGPFGYPLYAGYEIPKESSITEGLISDSSREPLICKTPTDPDKPIVTAAIFKQDSIIGNDLLKGPEYSIEGSTDGPLLSDVQAREVSLQQLHDKMEKNLENGVAVQVVEKIESPKKSLNRADSLPVRLEEEILVIPERNVVMETIKEDDAPINREMFKGKRASLPIIRTEMYESVKDAMFPTGSPKFEMFNNEQSPVGDSGDNGPPLITITEENETAMKTGEVAS